MTTATDRRLTQAMAQLAEVQLELDGERLRRQDSDALFERVFSGMSDAVLLVDARGRVARANHSALRMTGLELDALLGLRPHNVLPGIPGTPMALLRHAERGTLEGVDSQIERAGAEPLPVSVSCAVVHDVHGKIVGAVYSARDVTERRSAERHREAQLAVTVVLATSSTVAEALPNLLHALGEALAWDLARAWMVDREADVLRCRAVWERSEDSQTQPEPEVANDERVLALGQELPGAVWESGRAVWEDGPPDAHPAADAGAPEPSSQARACIPISAGQEVAGVLELTSREPRPRDERLDELLAALGVQIGNFIERRQAEEALGRVELFRTAFENTPVGMALFKASGEGRGRLLQANGALCAFLGRSEQELVGRQLHHMSHDDDRDAEITATSNLLDGRASTSVREARYLRADERVVWGVVHRALLHDERGTPLYGVAQVQDVTERKQAEGQLAHQALHDQLTGLPNRVLFLDRIGHALIRGRRDAVAKPTVMFVDLDRFKVVNDSLGHAAGDEILVETARRIGLVLRPGDTVARLGGDEFTVLCEGASQVDAVSVAERIVETIAEPFTVHGQDAFLSASVGIAASGAPDHTPELLVRDADAAMHRAKGGGGGGHAVFSEAMLGTTVQRLELETSLRRALEQEQLCLLYQPQVSLATGAIVGFEALVRRRDPERGLVSPAEFIPLAEETGLIVPLGEWVLREACREAQRWRERHPSWGPLKISVNISPRQLADPGLAALVSTTLEATATPPASLWLEVTESVVMGTEGASAELLTELVDIGVGIAIDDFGVGFSSLSRLKELPRVDAVKLDKSFIDGVCTTAGDRAIAAAGISLARALGATTVAEGVETSDQAAALRELDCQLAQGYLFAKPTAGSAIDALFATGGAAIA